MDGNDPAKICQHHRNNVASPHVETDERRSSLTHIISKGS
jgi:hypothetical protein